LSSKVKNVTVRRAPFQLCRHDRAEVTRDVEGAPKSFFTSAGVLRAIRIPPAVWSPWITCCGGAAVSVSTTARNARIKPAAAG
jgi:hypothetical protein